MRNDPVEQIASAYTAATGLVLRFQKPGQFSLCEDARYPALCRLMASGQQTSEQCRKAHLALQDPEGARTLTKTCFAGLTSSAVPVVRDGGLLGYLHTGHVYVDRKPGCERPGPGCLLPGRRKTRTSAGCPGVCRQTREMEPARYRGAVDLLGILGRNVAESPLLALPGSSFPAIDRAVEAIRADATRKWTLRALARQFGMHPGYFSQKFHQHTGRTLTAFLAGLRVDRARHLLAFTALPVSEVAFACGFRSLSQFNRTFRALTGRPPRAFRESRTGAGNPEAAGR